MNIHLEIAIRTAELYTNTNLSYLAALKQAKKEFKEKEKKKNDFKRILKEIIS